MAKYLYSIEDSGEEMTLDLLGGKGFHLVKMQKMGMPVPPAFILTTELCREYMASPALTMEKVKPLVLAAMSALSKKFGFMPLVSVRSGAKISMPGMMDTILNVGLDPATLPFWVQKLGNDCAGDSYARLIEMYSSVVKGLDRKQFEDKTVDARLSFYTHETGEVFPHAHEQVLGAVEAVFKSWNNERAKIYRKEHEIPDDLGTAVVIQAMVFGNFNEKSGTGVLFTRNPSTGENEVLGEFLVRAQGEDVVAGIRTPMPLSKMYEWNPEVSLKLKTIIETLEEKARDAQDVEFTIQDGELFILQTRNMKRTAQAALRIAVELYEDGVITAKEAIDRLTLKQFYAATTESVSQHFKVEATFTGIPASSGVTTGIAVFSAKDAVNCKEPCVLVSEETTPDDIAGMIASKAIVTATGGGTSHAAVVARGMDKIAVVGCTALKHSGGIWHVMNEDGSAKARIKPGTKLTVDGSTGRVWIDTEVPVVGGGNHELVVKLKKMMWEAYPYLRIVFKADDVEYGSTMLATYQMEDESKIAAEIQAAVAKMKQGVIDLTGDDAMKPEVDQMLEKALGLTSTKNGTVVMMLKVDALLTAASAGKDISVLLPGSDAGIEKKLKMKGYKVIRRVVQWEDLLDAAGLVMMPTNLSSEDQKKALKVLALKKRAGDKLESFEIATKIDRDRLDGKTAVAMVDDLALMSVLK